MEIKTYLDFNGRCEEAIEFYKKTLGAQVNMIMRFREAPEAGEGCAGVPPNSENKVMHSSLRIGNTEIMATDGFCQGQPEFKGFSLTHEVSDEAEADRVFAALGAGGQVQMPLAKTFFSPKFGMVADKFGVSWMVLVATPCPGVELDSREQVQV